MQNARRSTSQRQLGLHESWVRVQQTKPQLFAAVLLFDDEAKLFLVVKNGEWTLPNVPHSCTVPGMPLAAERALTPYRLHNQVQLQGVVDTFEPDDDERWYAIISARITGRRHPVKSDVVWVRNHCELDQLRSINPLVLAALRSAPLHLTQWRPAIPV